MHIIAINILIKDTMLILIHHLVDIHIQLRVNISIYMYHNLQLCFYWYTIFKTRVHLKNQLKIIMDCNKLRHLPRVTTRTNHNIVRAFSARSAVYGMQLLTIITGIFVTEQVGYLYDRLIGFAATTAETSSLGIWVVVVVRLKRLIPCRRPLNPHLTDCQFYCSSCWGDRDCIIYDR